MQSRAPGENSTKYLPPPPGPFATTTWTYSPSMFCFYSFFAMTHTVTYMCRVVKFHMQGPSNDLFKFGWDISLSSHNSPTENASVYIMILGIRNHTFLTLSCYLPECSHSIVSNKCLHLPCFQGPRWWSPNIPAAHDLDLLEFPPPRHLSWGKPISETAFSKASTNNLES